MYEDRNRYTAADLQGGEIKRPSTWKAVRGNSELLDSFTETL